MTGCASTRGYFVDRGRDASDIVTFTVGFGFGAKARVGPLSVGLLANHDTLGFRSGCLVEPSSGFASLDMIDLTYTLFGVERAGLKCYADGRLTNDRFKAYEADTTFGISIVPSKGTGDTFALISTNAPSRSRIPYYTQIEIVAGLIGTCRLGVNPGEFVDFLLGWFGIDIFSDDLEAKKQKEKKSNK